MTAATTTADASGAATTRVLVLPVGADRYAVALGAVHEVRGAEGLTRVPGTSALVLGVVNVRGRVVAVLDTAGLLGLGAGGAPAAIAVVGVERGQAGLALSALPFAVDLGEDLGPAELDVTTRRHRVGDGVASLVDLDALLDPARLTA